MQRGRDLKKIREREWIYHAKPNRGFCCFDELTGNGMENGNGNGNGNRNG